METSDSSFDGMKPEACTTDLSKGSLEPAAWAGLRLSTARPAASVRNKLFGGFARFQPEPPLGGPRPEWPRLSMLGFIANFFSR
jgi:hypothetical protein